MGRRRRFRRKSGDPIVWIFLCLVLCAFAGGLALGVGWISLHANLRIRIAIGAVALLWLLYRVHTSGGWLRLARQVRTYVFLLSVAYLVFAYRETTQLLALKKVHDSVLYVQITKVGFFLALFYIVFKRLRPKSFRPADGYIVLASGEFEHRVFAAQALGRALEPDEVVHHINGQRSDNRIENLCVMNREKHEHYHSWLAWKKSKSGEYPSIDEQIRVLQEEYGGTVF